MEWVIALIVVMLMPFGLNFWWVPRCDNLGIRIAEDRIAHERAPLSRPVGFFRAHEKALG